MTRKYSRGVYGTTVAGSSIGAPKQNLVQSRRETVVYNGIRVIVEAIDVGLLTRERMRRLHLAWDKGAGPLPQKSSATTSSRL